MKSCRRFEVVHAVSFWRDALGAKLKPPVCGFSRVWQSKLNYQEGQTAGILVHVSTYRSGNPCWNLLFFEPQPTQDGGRLRALAAGGLLEAAFDIALAEFHFGEAVGVECLTCVECSKMWKFMDEIPDLTTVLRAHCCIIWRLEDSSAEGSLLPGAHGHCKASLSHASRLSTLGLAAALIYVCPAFTAWLCPFNPHTELCALGARDPSM